LLQQVGVLRITASEKIGWRRVKGGSAEKLHSVEEVKQICEVLYSRLVSVL